MVKLKEAFCLVPTDAIDLTLPAAELQPGNVRLWTSGLERHLRQYEAGQSFDTTDVPNGTYVRSSPNPEHQLRAGLRQQQRPLRKVIVRGKPGHRKVEVPPWHGIDTEGWVARYGLGTFVG